MLPKHAFSLDNPIDKQRCYVNVEHVADSEAHRGQSAGWLLMNRSDRRACAHGLFALLLLVALLTACRTDAPPPAATALNAPSAPVPGPTPAHTPQAFHSNQDRFEAPLGLPFGLGEGQTALIPSEGVAISYVRFVEDNRCPADRECEWPGEVVQEYAVTKDGRELGTFLLGSHSAPSVIDNYLVSVWDHEGTALLVRRYEEEQPRVTSAELPANCKEGQGALSTYLDPEPTDRETHVVGIYTTGRYPGVANVYVDRAGVPLTLVLSAHEPTAWRIHRVDGVVLEQIILNGTGRQQAVGVDEVSIVDRSANSPEGTIISTVYRWGTEPAESLAAELETVTGSRITAFVGCYEANEFTIP